MAVSKVVFIALIAIIATPILLGYAFNITETVETDYRSTGDSVNVTQLLRTSTQYSYANADIYTMNTNFEMGYTNAQVLPIYENYIDSNTTMPGRQREYAAGSHATIGQPLSNFDYYYLQSLNEGSGGYLIVTIKDTNNAVYSTINQVKTFYYDRLKQTFSYSFGNNGTLSNTISVPDGYRIDVSNSGGYTGTCTVEYKVNGSDSGQKNVDFSAGYRFKTTPYLGHYLGVDTILPNYTRSVLFTVNLSSITDSSYEFNIGNVDFTKTTTAGVVKWTASIIDVAYPPDPIDIYYDNDSSNNTYQLRISADPNGWSVGSGLTGYQTTVNLRYVGQWPELIGEANYYQEYELDYVRVQNGELNMSTIAIGQKCETTPILRIDDAIYRGFEYLIIKDKTYDPSQFKTNPSTTINDPQIYGLSLEFGGNTYTVKDGNITMGTHQIPVKGLTFSSTPNAGGGYDNKIGNTIVSTTASPSTIIFNGAWSASIDTIAQESYTYNKTEWVAGSFGWDGIDHNFLLVGLLTSFGAFVALGIYARKSRSGGIIPLMIITGCAALLFFVML